MAGHRAGFSPEQASLSELDVYAERLGAWLKSDASRPRKVKTLSNTINALFQNALQELELVALINELQTHSLISISDNNVSYSLPT